ncbi:MAG TPA: transglutaminaseTgpA domain-containing protein, partial [Methylibium sp.]|nr:transglutaminaseTgpA domain-containing protein [Methylibium sp.]
MALSPTAAGHAPDKRSPLPRWPGWRHLPREARDTLFLLGVIAWTVLPHAGHLPVWCSALTAAVLLWRGSLALAGAALPGRWVVAAVLLLALGLTLWSHRTLVGKEAGVTLLVALVAMKTLELRARRDAFVVFFLGFFLVLTHFLYSQTLAVAAAALGSVWGLLAALVLAHMPVGQPSLGLAVRLAARFALLGAPVMVALFLLFPRLGPLWGVPQDAGAKSGLSGELRMGMIAELAADDSIAMRLRVLDGRLPPPQQLYFRGPVLGSFDGLSWRVAEPRFPAALRPGQALRVSGAPVELEVTLEPLRLATVPVLEATPELPPLEGVRARLREDLHWSTDRPLLQRQRFIARAWPQFGHGPTEAVLGLQDYLELPPGHNPRTLAWAAALRREPRYAEADARTLAAALFAHIRSQGYGYTLTPGVYDEDGRGSAVDEFWLDRRLGFCEHYASAFVVVMRALDVPARIVTGYQGAERDEATGTLVVRQSFAHAWAEYWQPGEGWVRADPTAAVAPERIERSLPLRPPPGLVASALDGLAPGLLLRARALWEGANHHWNQWVLSYSRDVQFDLLRRLGVASPSWEDLARLMIGLLCTASLAGAAWAWWDQRRQDPWLRAWSRVRRHAVALGLPGAAHVAPRALATTLQSRGGAAAARAAAALHAFEALRYARADSPTPPGAARRLADEALRALAALA